MQHFAHRGCGAWRAGCPAQALRRGYKRAAPWVRPAAAIRGCLGTHEDEHDAQFKSQLVFASADKRLKRRFPVSACAASLLPGPRRRPNSGGSLLGEPAWSQHRGLSQATGPPPTPPPPSFLRLPWSNTRSPRDKDKETIDDEAQKSISQGVKQLRQSEVVVQRSIGGNIVIAVAKFVAYWYCGSTAMLTEAIHSLADTGNQCLLLVGLRESVSVPDKRHQYGYGKSVYMWGLVSAVGCFWLGSCMSLMGLLLPGDMSTPGWVTWSVLGLSFAVDGYVLYINLRGLAVDKPRNRSWLQHLHRIRDPTTVAVVVEDVCACAGVFAALLGVALVELTGMNAFDAAASLFISGMMAGAGGYLGLRNQRFLLGQAIEPERLAAIELIMLRRGSIEDIHHVQSQWLSPEYFAFKAEVDFSGHFLNGQLFDRYAPEYRSLCERLQRGELLPEAFVSEMRVLQTLYAEDVSRVLEREVRAVEADIRREHCAAFVDLEPDSRSFGVYAIDEWRRAKTVDGEARENWAEFTKNVADQHGVVTQAAAAAAAAAAADKKPSGQS